MRPGRPGSRQPQRCRAPPRTAARIRTRPLRLFGRLGRRADWYREGEDRRARPGRVLKARPHCYPVWGDASSPCSRLGRNWEQKKGRHGRRKRAGGRIRTAGGRAAPGQPVLHVGAVRQRATVRAGREDYSANGEARDYLPARPGQVPRVPVGWGRAGRVLQYRAAAVPGPGLVERPSEELAAITLCRKRRDG
jgi:hypothetical protein